jgi:DNA-directed RNA polymerase subunit M
MEFCPKCGAILMMKKTKVGCPKCNYIAKGDVDLEMKEEVHERVEVAVVDEKKDNPNPITDFDCRKCNSKRAYFWIRQMRSGDEAESKFYECVKCKNTTRVDD